MIPVKLELHNFLAYRDPDPLNLEGIHIACLAGENGAGKSSLLDAITWALWGKARTASPDDLIHQGQKDMRVALTFDYAGARYKVIRQRTGGRRIGASLLEFQVRDGGKWRGISEPTLRATERKIVDLLRLDYDTFVNSAFLMQGKADEFTTRTPAERKQVLANILGLSQWEVYEERAREKVRQCAEQIQKLDGRLEEIERELDRREEYEAELAVAEAEAREVSSLLEAAEKEWADLERTRAELIAVQKQIDELTRRIVVGQQDLAEMDAELAAARLRADVEAFAHELESIRQQLASLEQSEVQREEWTAQRQTLAVESAILRGENETLGPQTEPLKKRLETLETAIEPVCPTCGQPLDEDHRHTIIVELQGEVATRREKYRQNSARIKELASGITDLDRGLIGLAGEQRQWPALQNKLVELQTAVAGAEEAGRRIEMLLPRRERWLQGLAEDTDRREALEKTADELERQLVGASIRQLGLDQLRESKRLADERVGGARQTLATLANFEKQRERRLAERRGLAEQRGLFEDLREAFGKRGVPAMIIETAVPEIEMAANELLDRMTDGRMRVRLETQKELKTGEMREALDIFISDELGTRSYEMYSGGETFRINFAIRIALSKLLARRAGAQLRALFIDEGFGTQDTEGRERLVAAINSIQHDFDRILVITHIEELKHAFPVRIEVTKTPDGSQLAIA